MSTQHNYTDHLGNIRLQYAKVEGVLRIMEEDNYYPFGLKHARYNQSMLIFMRKPISDIKTTKMVYSERSYKYKYNGKELQEEFGLNWYSMDMRSYDPEIARWTSMDPVTHHTMSPYVAFDNNPIFWIDPSGADSTDPITEVSTVIKSTVDRHNITHISQITRTNTVTTDDIDGSVTITSSVATITNTVDINGNITKGTTGTTTTGTISIDADGEVCTSDSVTTSDVDSSSSSALTEWTNVVSDFNSNNDEVYNKDKINTIADRTTQATELGVAILSAYGGIDKLLSKKN